jgi:hypothetical protein
LQSNGIVALCRLRARERRSCSQSMHAHWRGRTGSRDRLGSRQRLPGASQAEALLPARVPGSRLRAPQALAWWVDQDARTLRLFWQAGAGEADERITRERLHDWRRPRLRQPIDELRLARPQRLRNMDLTISAAASQARKLG